MSLATPIRQRRNEVEVVADAVAAILGAGIVKRDALNIAALARATGIKPSDIRDAWRRREDGQYRPPQIVEVTPATMLTGQFTDEPSEPATASRARPRTAWNKAPEGDTRTCKRCGETKPIDEFQKRTDADSRRTICDACRKRDSRMRYLSVSKQSLMNAVGIAFVIGEDDDVRGLVCTDCNCPIRVGDEVHGTASLAHVACPAMPAPIPEVHAVRVTEAAS